MDWNFSTFSNETAIISRDSGKIKYSSLLSHIDSLAEKIPKRCLVFSFCGNNIGSLVGYISFIKNRIVPFMLEEKKNQDHLSILLETYKPDYLWCPSHMANRFTKSTEIYTVFGYSLLKTPYNNVYPLYKNLALLLTTSGSTGSPKLVRQSYENIRTNTESIVKCLNIGPTDRAITTLPMSYTYGLSIINTHLYAGASIILTSNTLMQREFWEHFKEYNATSFGGVPYTYEMLERLRFIKMELPSLRTMTQAGGKLPPAQHRKFAQYASDNHKNFVVMYGQTEATARMSYLPAEKSSEKCGSIGIAIHGGHLSLIDINGKEINEPDTPGELVYKGKNVSLGYAESGDDLSKDDENDGILFTGDIATEDTDGYYYIIGRKKRFLKIYGSRINLDEIEIILKSKIPSLDCACCGRDDKMWIFITERSKNETVKDLLVKEIGLQPSAFEVEIITKIPKNSSGKVIYRKLPIDLEA
ncbi:MAG: AMP-binding protein [Lentisphaeria bacterium]|nr:AMP-binding protein [Lentisphaeria bacterium]NQZ70905.1 AMP-binding protein [Lentisphaeria bacterium]